MSAGRFGPLLIQVCLPCGGAWLECGRLGQIIAAGPEVARRLAERLQAAHAAPAVRGMGAPLCPACRSPLQSQEYPTLAGVWVDTCQWCEGHWVTQTCLVRLAVALQGGSVWDQHYEERTSQSAVAVPGSPAARTAGRSEPATVVPSGRPGMVSCVRCGEPNSEQVAVCWACGNPFQGPVVGNCPQCEAEMRRITSGDVTFSACGGCGGICITPNLLNQLLKQPPITRQRLTARIGQCDPALCRRRTTTFLCPRCRGPMTAGPLGVISREPIHACTRCFGLYLELDRVRTVLT